MNLEQAAIQIQNILKTKGGCNTAVVYPRSNFGTLAVEVNQLFSAPVLPSSQFIISIERQDVQNLMTVLSMLSAQITQSSDFGGRIYFEMSNFG
jgi:hypothetical protein